MYKIAFSICFFLVVACSSKAKQKNIDYLSPLVEKNGELIKFQSQKISNNFETEKLTSSLLVADLASPAKVAATVENSGEIAHQNIVLFDNSDLASSYSMLKQHLMNINQIKNVTIKQRKIEYDRIYDLKVHGAASGKDLLEAQTALALEETNLANEKAALIEHETKFKMNGFNPEMLRKAKNGAVFIICDIPENLIHATKEGQHCSLKFNAYPNETFEGKIDEITDVVDPQTRMIKLRISVKNTDDILKAGMFAMVSFGINEGNHLTISKSSVITIQGRNYAFVKTSPIKFERREISIGNEINNRIIVFSGIREGENVVSSGLMQLKGLSFGY